MSGEHNLWNALNYQKYFDLNPNVVVDNVERINVNDVSPEAFVERYEKIYKPVRDSNHVCNSSLITIAITGRHHWRD